MQQRDTYFDFLRGIAIIMVIGIHTYTDGLVHFNLFLRQFLNCAVPIFLAISGYFIGHKSFVEQGSCVKFLKKHVPRVYIRLFNTIWCVNKTQINFLKSLFLGKKEATDEELQPYILNNVMIDFFKTGNLKEFAVNRMQKLVENEKQYIMEVLKMNNNLSYKVDMDVNGL